MKILIDDEELYGNLEGAEIWSVTTIDPNYPSDSMNAIWVAKDKDDLYSQVKDAFVQGNPEVEPNFKRDWGYTIIYTKIGNKI